MQKFKLIRFFDGLALFILALVLTIPLTLLSFIVTPISYIIKFKWIQGLNDFGSYLRRLAVSVDQFGNGSCATMFQFILTKKGALKFGEIDDTVSYVLGRNKYKNKLTIFGKLIVFVLDVIDRDHVEKAINHKIKQDQEAILRLQNDEYFK